MRIGLLVKSIDGAGGIQKDYMLWYEMFKSHNDEVYLFILQKPQQNLNDKNIIYLKGFNNFLKGIYLRKTIKEIGEFDLFLINAEYLKYYIPKEYVKKYFITIHNTWSHKVLNRGINGLIRKIRLTIKYQNENIITISKSIKDDIIKKLNIKVRNAYIIYSPHNIQKIKELSNELKIEDSYILAIGRLNKNKNHKLLIDSFKKLKNSNLKLYIIGTGPLKEELKEYIKKNRLEDRVLLLGFKENPYPYIKNAKVLISSSLSEGLPRVLVEALILKTPIVSTLSSNGIKELMSDELRDFIVDFDSNELAKKIELTLKNYPKIEKKYYEKFDIENAYKKFLELI